MTTPEQDARIVAEHVQRFVADCGDISDPAFVVLRRAHSEGLQRLAGWEPLATVLDDAGRGLE